MLTGLWRHFSEGSNFWSSDLFGSGYAGLGGIISTNLVGRAVTSYSYTPVFFAMGVMHPLAFLLVRSLRASGEAAA
jgi:hypothetical protein